MSAVVNHQQRLFAKYDFGFKVRKSMRLCRVMELLKESEFMDPLPTRRNLLDLLEAGTIEGKLTDYGWIVYEDSLLDWLKQFSEPVAA